MVRCTLLCEIVSHGKEGIRWLVGCSLMPFTVVSVLECVHFLDDAAGEPDLVAEADDLRVLLPGGLEIVGVATTANASIKEACDRVLKLIGLLHPSQSIKPNAALVTCFRPDSSHVEYHYCKCIHDENVQIEAIHDVVRHENPSQYLWENMQLLRCKLELAIPVYFENSSDYEPQLLAFLDKILEDLESRKVFCFIEGFTGDHNKPVHFLVNLNAESQLASTKDSVDTLLCSGLSLSLSQEGEIPYPAKVNLMLCKSRNGKASAPMAEYITSLRDLVMQVVNLNLDVLCLAHGELSLHEALTSFLMPTIEHRLLLIRDTVSKEHTNIEKLQAFHFCPLGCIHPISWVYNMSYGESDQRIMDHRRMLHLRLGLPLDRPLFRVSNALSLCKVAEKANGRHRLCNVHLNLPGSGVAGGHSSIINGSYEYYHYLQDNFDDTGWGCAYRSLQTIISWFQLQQYTTIDVPTHRKIQEVLVDIGDKETSFIGSKEWIGAIELSFVLDKLIGVSSKILNVRSGSELPDKCRELAHHFEAQGTPIMIGGGVLAYTLLGVDYNETTGESAFLILDPHYTGAENLKSIWGGGWCGWKKAISSTGEEFFLRSKFYNLLLPQRPNTF